MKDKIILTNDERRVVTLAILGGPEAEDEAVEIMSTWPAMKCLKIAQILQGKLKVAAKIIRSETGGLYENN